jgi:hypothetical protein
MAKISFISIYISLNVSLNILRFHKILRPNESFHTFLQFFPVNLIACY